MEQEKITKIIAEAIKSYVDQDGKSYRQIGLYTDISYGYIYRMSNQDIPVEQLNPINIYKVLKLVKNRGFAHEIVSQNPDWERRVQTWGGHSKVINLVEDRDTEKIITANTRNTLAFLLACNHRGTTKSQLSEIGGGQMVDAAEWLIDEDILQEKDGVITPSRNQSETWLFSFSKDSLKERIIPILNDYYNLHREETDKSYIFAKTNTWNNAFLQRLQKKIIEFRQWVDKEGKKEENKGTRPAFITLVMDSFSKDKDAKN